MDIEKITLKSTSTDVLVCHGGPRITDPINESDAYTIAYAAHSSGTLKLDGTNTLNVDENDIFLIVPNTPFQFLPIKGLRRMDVYYCFFSANALSDRISTVLRTKFSEFCCLTDNNIKYIRAADTPSLEIRDIFIRMIDEDISALPCSTEALISFLPVLLIKILRAYKTPAATAHSHITDEAIRFINRHMYEKISLNTIAEHLNLSSSFICHRFKKDTGMTTSEFINHVRVEKIKDILANTSKPIKTIPQMFTCSPEHLKRTFRRSTGMNMTEYRNKYNYKSKKA